MTPTQRTLAELRKQGYTAWIVEKWNPWAKIRQDLFGIIDIVAIGKGSILGVQTTSDTHHADHVVKAKASPNLEIWKQSGGRFQVWSWGKRGERGKLKKWTLRSEEL